MTRPIDAEFAAHHLAGLASLEAAIVFAARALVYSFPAVNKPLVHLQVIIPLGRRGLRSRGRPRILRRPRLR